MFEVLFGLGFALMVAAVVGAVAVFLLKILFAVLWIPLKLAWWFAASIGTLIASLVCLALLPFAIAGGLLALLLSIVLSPPFLLLVIGVMAWFMYTGRHEAHRPALPESTHTA